MPSAGTGVREVRIRDQAGAFRVIHLANRPEAVYVLQPAKRNFVLGKSWCSPGQRCVLQTHSLPGNAPAMAGCG